MSTTLMAQALEKSFGGEPAISGIDLTVVEGEVHGVVGPNGSGKSTVLSVIAGRSPADSGSVRICGEPVGDPETDRLVGYVPQCSSFPGGFTGGEILALHDRIYGRGDLEFGMNLCSFLGVPEKNLVATYSEGVRKRLSVIMAMLRRPPLLVLDDPYSGLDARAIRLLSTLIRDYVRTGGAVVLATTDSSRAERECDVVTVLNAGVIIAYGRPDELAETAPWARDLSDLVDRASRPRPREPRIAVDTSGVRSLAGIRRPQSP